jgi:primosomal protein N' (replication factor Y) (superfamily II helicase)
MSATSKSTAPIPYADVAVNLPVHQTYTYKIPEGLQAHVAPGRMVRVPVRKRQVEGVVVALTDKTNAPKNRLKPIEKILTPDYHIAPDLMALGRWMSNYYLAGPGEALASITFFGLSDEKPRREQRYRLAHFADDASASDLPEALMDDSLTEAQRDVVRCLEEELNAPMTQAELCRRSNRSASVVKTLEDKGVLTADSYEQERDDQYSQGREALATRHKLTDEQQVAFDKIASAIDEPRFESFLLYGITGSGKTEVYLQAIERVLADDRQAIVLVPEISLTPQAVERFRSRFGDRVGVYHSHLTRGQKFDLWRRIESGEITVLIGARSAVFAPFKRLGLIVIDEEHEHSYKQSDPAPRYHARDVGVWRARQFGVPAILGSATPSLESLLNARPDLDEDSEREAKYTWLALEKRAGGASLPEIELIDMAAGVRDERHTGLLSERLETEIGRASCRERV